LLRARLKAEGVGVHETAQVTQVEREGNGVAVTVEGEAGSTRLTGSHLLVAAGRRPMLDGLGLDAAGIRHDAGRLIVDDRLRTTNRRVFAAGDVAGGPQFTHVAAYHASVVIKNALFRIPAKADHSAVPAVTYTSPEIASVGLTSAQAKDRYGDGVQVLTWPFHENDRAQAERDTEGFVRAATTAKGKILGCTIAGAHAGELIQPWVLAVQNGLRIGALAQMIAPYPTLGETSKRAAGAFYTPKLFAARTRRLVRALQLLG
jgi:pyruvate/2-oxoglutarate dehydrogenase complex dihydrolipoamide dehydrogenase (E3) component